MPREKWYTVPPAVFPTSYTFLQTTSYYGADDIESMVTAPGATGAITSMASAANLPLYRVDNAGGTTWTSADNLLRVRAGGLHATASYVYGVHGNGTPRTLKKIALTDGTTTWSAATNPTTGSSHIACATSDDSAVFVTDWATSNPTLAKYNASGTNTDTLTMTGKGPVDIATNDTLIVLLSDTEELIAYDIATFSSGSSPAWTLDLTAGTLPATTISNTCRVRHDGSGGFWVSYGYSAADDYIVHVTSAGVMDIEIDLQTHSAMAGTIDRITGLDVDKFGHVYALATNGYASAEVLRFDSSGAYVSSSYDQGITLSEGGSPVHISLAVDDDGYIYIGRNDGDVTVLSQS